MLNLETDNVSCLSNYNSLRLDRKSFRESYVLDFNILIFGFIFDVV